MSAKYFLDTNILVYSFDLSDRRKQRIANDLIKTALADHSGIISTQVVQEFLNVATRKFARKMNAVEARAYLQNVLSPLCEAFPSVSLYGTALDIQQEAGLSFYDSLILAAASEQSCALLYSEDLQHGQDVRGVRVTNPFAQT